MLWIDAVRAKSWLVSLWACVALFELASVPLPEVWVVLLLPPSWLLPVQPATSTIGKSAVDINLDSETCIVALTPVSDAPFVD